MIKADFCCYKLVISASAQLFYTSQQLHGHLPAGGFGFGGIRARAHRPLLAEAVGSSLRTLAAVHASVSCCDPADATGRGCVAGGLQTAGCGSLTAPLHSGCPLGVVGSGWRRRCLHNALPPENC